MAHVVVELRTDGPFRASETIPELRACAEALYAPMRVVGLWQDDTGMHLCPQQDLGLPCPHDTDDGDPKDAYSLTLQRRRHANLSVSFPPRRHNTVLGLTATGTERRELRIVKLCSLPLPLCGLIRMIVISAHISHINPAGCVVNSNSAT